MRPKFRRSGGLLDTADKRHESSGLAELPDFGSISESLGDFRYGPNRDSWPKKHVARAIFG
jgi:hypothetical protein